MMNEERRHAARSEMCARIDALAGEISHVSQMRLVQELDTIRRTASRAGLESVAIVVRGMETAIARGERGPMVMTWLDMLRGVCGCEESSAATGEQFAAHAAIRLAS